MPRKQRLFVKNFSQHILLKSLSTLSLFKESIDYETFLSIVLDLIDKKLLAIHSYLLLPNSVEFLLTPKESNSIAKFLQTLSRRYVGYYNNKYTHKGTIWAGRYKSSLVDDKNYLLEVMKFIELQTPKIDIYSSLAHNYFNEDDALITQHYLYQDKKNYQTFFKKNSDKEKNLFIKDSLEKQSITGTKEFIDELEKETGKELRVNSRGRPKKEELKQRKKMYKNLVVLDKQTHATLKVNPLQNLLFAKYISHLPITLKEMLSVSEIFPVVFSANENPSLVAIVSLGGENLAISMDGKWIDTYIPTHIGKYPFALASTKENDEQKIIMIDQTASMLSKSKGKQLFKKSGENSDVLNKAINVLVEHEENLNETKKLSKEIADSGILEVREISVENDGEKEVLVGGFKVVSEEKLKSLDSKTLENWEQRGILKLIDAHLKSLQNIELLFKLAQQRQA